MHSKLEQGSIVFVEKMEKKPVKFEELNWYKSIVGHEDIVKLNISMTGFVVDSLEVKMNKNKTLNDLKQRIARVVNVAPEDFKIKRKHVVSDLKDLELTLAGYGLNSGAMLEIKKGKAVEEGIYELNIFVATLVQPVNYSAGQTDLL